MSDKPAEPGDAAGQWYWCFKHQKVEGPGESTEMDRMGPYPSREAAEHWRERVAERNEAWEEPE
jgi:hypothetical protein